jgi:hypothetical protein
MLSVVALPDYAAHYPRPGAAHLTDRRQWAVRNRDRTILQRACSCVSGSCQHLRYWVGVSDTTLGAMHHSATWANPRRPTYQAWLTTLSLELAS